MKEGDCLSDTFLTVTNRHPRLSRRGKIQFTESGVVDTTPNHQFILK